MSFAPAIASLPVALLLPSATIGWIMLIAWTAAACLPSRAISSRQRWALEAVLAVSVIFWFRWPLIWLPHAIYPDESQMLAGARTLLHDPVFWRSVDGETGGPLDFFALIPAALLSGSAGFAGARITALLLAAGSAVVMGVALAKFTGRAIARVAILPFVLFEAFTTSPEFFHYSTELVPTFLMAVATYLVIQHRRAPGALCAFAIGLALGLIPFAKLQAAPGAAAAGIALFCLEIKQRRVGLARLMAAGALLPACSIITVLAATAELEAAYISYLRQNLVYAGGGRLPVFENSIRQWRQMTMNGYLPCWMMGSSLVVIITLVRWPRLTSEARRTFLAGGAIVAAAAFCVLAPGRPYQHYLSLLFVPITLLVGVALWAINRETSPSAVATGKVCALGFIVLAAPLLLLRLSPRGDPYIFFNTTGPTAAEHELVARARAVSQPSETLGVWGWKPALYVETDLRQATRQSVTERQILSGPWQSYYLRLYVQDIQRSRPPVFIDAVGPGNFRFEDRRWAHEALPILRDWIEKNYQFSGDFNGSRLYVRRDRLDRLPGRQKPR